MILNMSHHIVKSDLFNMQKNLFLLGGSHKVGLVIK